MNAVPSVMIGIYPNTRTSESSSTRCWYTAASAPIHDDNIAP